MLLEMVSNMEYAQMMIFALFCGALYGIGFYAVGMIVVWLIEILLKEKD